MTDLPKLSLPKLSLPALILAAVRSALFVPIFYIGSFLIVVTAVIMSFVSREGLMRACMGWSRFHRWCARWVLGQRIAVEGVPPGGTVLIVCKHEAMFEAIDIVCLFDRAMIAAKKELTDLPLFGRAALRYGIIPIDRKSGGKAIRAIQAGGKQAKEQGRAIGLFPEGTRVPHGERPDIRAGFAALYTVLKVPVVPVAVDSGLLAPRGSFLKRPGTVTYRIGELIPPGLPREEAEARVHAAINALNG